MIKLSVKQKIYLYSGLASAIIIAIIFLVLNPLFSRIKICSEKLHQNQTELNNLFEKWEQISEFKKQSQKTEDQLKKINQALIDKDHILEFITELEEAASLTNNLQEIRITSQSSSQTKKAASELKFQILLYGNFNNFVRFLNYLENMPQSPYLEKIQISRLSATEISAKEKLSFLQEGDIKTLINIKIFLE